MLLWLGLYIVMFTIYIGNLKCCVVLLCIAEVDLEGMVLFIKYLSLTRRAISRSV